MLFTLNYSFAGFSNIEKEKKEISDREPIEMIISFQKLNSKRFSELNENLVSIPGITYLGACPELNVHYFQFDSEKYSSVEDAFNALTLKTREFQPLLKVGASISDVKSACALK